MEQEQHLNIESYNRYFDDLEKYLSDGRFLAVFTPYFDKALKTIQGKVQSRMPVGATSRARNDIRTLKLQTAQGLEGHVVYAESKDGASVYAPVIEFGRRAGAKMPPWREGSALYDWVKLRVRSNHKKETGKNMKRGAKGDAEILTAAFLIARKIARDGTAPKYPFALGWADSTVPAYEIITLGLGKAMEAAGNL